VVAEVPDVLAESARAKSFEAVNSQRRKTEGGYMKLSTLAITVALSLSFAAFPTFAKNEIVERAHRTTHVIQMVDVLGAEPMKCSATAIGPHALLTASHCELPTDDIAVDGQPATIFGILRDGADHSIYYVDSTFPQWATFADELPSIADRVFLFGNPGSDEDIYREGYVAAIKTGELTPFSDSQTAIYFDLNGFFGDSGAAVFNAKGEIVGIISVLLAQTTKDDKDKVSIKFMSGLCFRFTEAQLLASASWKSGDAIPKKDAQAARRAEKKIQRVIILN
jgi:hypothetical protein